MRKLILTLNILMLTACATSPELTPTATNVAPTATYAPRVTPAWQAHLWATRTAIIDATDIPILTTPTFAIDTPTAYDDFAMHPDGQTLVAVGEQQLDLFTVNAEGLTLRETITPGIDVIRLEKVAYTPDGEQILVGGTKPDDDRDTNVPEPVLFAAQEDRLEVVFESDRSYIQGSTVALAAGQTHISFVYNLAGSSCGRSRNTTVTVTTNDLQLQSIESDYIKPDVRAVAYENHTAIAVSGNACSPGWTINLFEGGQQVAHYPYSMVALSENYLVLVNRPSYDAQESNVLVLDRKTQARINDYIVPFLPEDIQIGWAEAYFLVDTSHREPDLLIDLLSGEVVAKLALPDLAEETMRVNSGAVLFADRLYVSQGTQQLLVYDLPEFDVAG